MSDNLKRDSKRESSRKQSEEEKATHTFTKSPKKEEKKVNVNVSDSLGPDKSKNNFAKILQPQERQEMKMYFEFFKPDSKHKLQKKEFAIVDRQNALNSTVNASFLENYAQILAIAAIVLINLTIMSEQTQ